MKCISVPTSQDAMQRLDLDVSLEGDLIEVTITDEQFQSLIDTGVISQLNQFIEINIDEFEDEKIIGIRDLTLAKSILGQVSPSDRANAEVLVSQINKAIEYNTGVFFYF
ncbi:hypothetical protein J1781_22835 [Rahnella sp. C60]|jgi:hypothetical protein|uniref:Uncharacterized protein n=1 Tax=Rahnella perminowiae TaxID=2816244 RepID=A0ABS6L2Y4_9GAMM|nr:MULTISPECIES: hypothetical protein [Rahnella]UJD89330.1 hypothetical protein FS594_11330 [Rahnella aquatilis]MBU9811889.1 hypothetical protein [Rahnella perminowiae]MBU9817669.1 hypothetical protein [Rahnella perminowiae]MBU9828248.1 hypothetical protein [Rahnella perminowiae]MBU9836036.1 hypothetical protein [Rahnella perminowiae]